MEPDSEPLSAIQFVEDTTDVVDKDPDWDRESDWSEVSSIAWSEDEDDRLCNEILRQSTESWPLVNERIFDELDPPDWNLVQNYFNQNQQSYLDRGIFFNLDHGFHSHDLIDQAMRQIEECFRVSHDALWYQLSLQLNP